MWGTCIAIATTALAAASAPMSPARATTFAGLGAV
jgi:hypothetical protein